MQTTLPSKLAPNAHTHTQSIALHTKACTESERNRTTYSLAYATTSGGRNSSSSNKKSPMTFTLNLQRNVNQPRHRLGRSSGVAPPIRFGGGVGKANKRCTENAPPLPQAAPLVNLEGFCFSHHLAHQGGTRRAKSSRRKVGGHQPRLHARGSGVGQIQQQRDCCHKARTSCKTSRNEG